jgi:phage terminase large subunit-like protein
VVCGRRSGKSRIASLVAVYEAAFVDHREHLAPGETAVVALIARDRSQARVLFRYVKGLLRRPMLARLVVRETASEIELSVGTSIEIMTAGQNVRGFSMAAAICDEIAYWPSSELCAGPDREVLSALRPVLSTLGGKLIA